MTAPTRLADPPSAAPALTIHRFALDGGQAVAVPVPAPDAIPPIEAWPIDPVERRHAAKFGARRQNTWIAGRLALREACRAVGVEPGPILPDDRRAPRLPATVSASLTHTDRWALAWAAPADGRTRGIDLEDPTRGGLHLQDMLLTAPEAAALAARPAERQKSELIRRFALKEAVYKAIDPRYRRYVDFKEVALWPDPPGAEAGTARIDWILAEGEAPPAEMILRWRLWGDAGWLCTAEARWGG